MYIHKIYFLSLSMCALSALSKRIFHTFLCKVLCIVFLLLVILNASAQPSSFTEQYEWDVKQRMLDDHYTVIEKDEVSFPIFVRESQQIITKGVIIFMPDANQSIGSDISLTAVAKTMPRWGWTTVVMPTPTVSFLDPNELIEQANAEPSEPVTDTETPTTTKVPEPVVVHPQHQSVSYPEASYALYQKQLQIYLEMVMAHTDNIMGHRLIVAKGMSAATLVKAITEESVVAPDALMIANPYWPQRDLNNTIAGLVADTQLPIIDITSEIDNIWSTSTREARALQAKLRLKEVYRQVHVYEHPYSPAKLDVFARDIYGFTTYLGW